jgi:nicotinamidase-related amidase
LTIDVQNDFTLSDGTATVEGTDECLPNMQSLAAAYREQNGPIVHVVRLYKADGSNVDISRRAMIEEERKVVRPGTPGAELVDQLKTREEVELESEELLAGKFQSIGEREWMMYKPRWGAFYETSLEFHLEKLSLNTIVICGCNFPNCPRATIYEASERDYRIIFVPDATSGTYDRGLEELEEIGVHLMRTDEVVDWLQTH